MRGNNDTLMVREKTGADISVGLSRSVTVVTSCELCYVLCACALIAQRALREPRRALRARRGLEVLEVSVATHVHPAHLTRSTQSLNTQPPSTQ
jgi:hypothetical protein